MNDIKNELQRNHDDLLKAICKNENITLVAAPNPDMECLTDKVIEWGSGLAARYGDFNAIFYNGTAAKWKQRIIVAHEIAHHLLGHLEPSCTLSTEVQELEANVFSAVITAMGVYKEYEQKDDT